MQQKSRKIKKIDSFQNNEFIYYEFHFDAFQPAPVLSPSAY